jgi:uncharacterized protein DUF4365
MPARQFDPTKRLGINAVEKVVTRELCWIWREQSVADFGIDAHIEAVGCDGKPTGNLFGVQVKSGPSYFRGAGSTIPFYVDEDHLKYWNQHTLPVLLILYNPETENMIWQWANTSTARPTDRSWCINIPKEQIFAEASKAELQNEVWVDDSIGMRRRFALDRQFMQEIDQRDPVFVRIEVWINKSLSYRGLEIRFDNPYKEDPDHSLPIMATSHYSINDVMHHFLPWLDYESYDDPDEVSGELEVHILAVYLSKAAKAFLELEAFFERPWPNQPDELDEYAVEDDR